MINIWLLYLFWKHSVLFQNQFFYLGAVPQWSLARGSSQACSPSLLLGSTIDIKYGPAVVSTCSTCSTAHMIYTRGCQGSAVASCPSSVPGMALSPPFTNHRADCCHVKMCNPAPVWLLGCAGYLQSTLSRQVYLSLKYSSKWNINVVFLVTRFTCILRIHQDIGLHTVVQQECSV